MADESETKLIGNIDTQESENSIPSKSFSKKIMSVSLSNIQVRDWLQKQRDSIQPWGEFLNGKKFSPPKSITTSGKRILKNIDQFQSNYLFVFLGLLVFCLLTSPVLLIALAACLGACYIISIKNADKKISFMGRELSLAQQYAGVGIMSFPLFWIAGAGSAVFWVIGASLFVIVLHAVMYSTTDEAIPFVDLEMETV